MVLYAPKMTVSKTTSRPVP